jgi:hypothetical protein
MRARTAQSTAATGRNWSVRKTEFGNFPKQPFRNRRTVKEGIPPLTTNGRRRDLARAAYTSRCTASFGDAFIRRFHSLMYSRMKASSVAAR